MKKFTLIIALACLLYFTLASQPCLQEGITITSQAQIDNFPANYPGCTEIGGYLQIAGFDIERLDSLQSITKIWGGLGINGGPFGGNPLLTDLTGLHNLTLIGGDLVLQFNANLNDLSALGNVTSIGGDFRILSSDALVDFTGLGSLVSIGSNVDIWGNDELTGVNGLENLTSIGGSLTFGGFMAFVLVGNPSLNSLSDFENLTSIGGGLFIRKNDMLPNLAGLENIDALSISSLGIHDNETLSSCHVLSICEYLLSPGGTAEIYGNAVGCMNREQVEDACYVGTPANAKVHFDIYPNPAKDILHVSSDGSQDYETHICNIFGQEVLSGLFSVETIDVSSLSPGVYFIVINTTNTRITRQLFIL